MNDRERRVLKALEHLDRGRATYFSTIARRTKLKKRLVRVICRRLARKGLAQHIKGLFYDGGEKDGLLAGSGYGITTTGRAMLSAIDKGE